MGELISVCRCTCHGIVLGSMLLTHQGLFRKFARVPISFKRHVNRIHSRTASIFSECLLTTLRMPEP